MSCRRVAGVVASPLPPNTHSAASQDFRATPTPCKSRGTPAADAVGSTPDVPRPRPSRAGVIRPPRRRSHVMSRRRRRAKVLGRRRARTGGRGGVLRPGGAWRGHRRPHPWAGCCRSSRFGTSPAPPPSPRCNLDFAAARWAQQARRAPQHLSVTRRSALGYSGGVPESLRSEFEKLHL